MRQSSDDPLGINRSEHRLLTRDISDVGLTRCKLYMIGRHQVLNDVVKQRLQLVHVILGIPTAAH